MNDSRQNYTKDKKFDYMYKGKIYKFKQIGEDNEFFTGAKSEEHLIKLIDRPLDRPVFIIEVLNNDETSQDSPQNIDIPYDRMKKESKINTKPIFGGKKSRKTKKSRKMKKSKKSRKMRK